jgi:6-phosphogluconolactonase (cycloisomerase 2 family)
MMTSRCRLQAKRETKIVIITLTPDQIRALTIYLEDLHSRDNPKITKTPGTRHLHFRKKKKEESSTLTDGQGPISKA